MSAVAGSPRGCTALLRGLITALLLPSLVLAALDLHTSDRPHAAFERSRDVLADARHPLAPEHMESSSVVRTAPCLACLLHSKTSCGAVTALAPETDPVDASAAPAPIQSIQPFSLAYGLGSRGPPLA
jgi:hypothetical protein